jgi:branched-chain amino acid transport system substrate-binding protein
VSPARQKTDPERSALFPGTLKVALRVKLDVAAFCLVALSAMAACTTTTVPPPAPPSQPQAEVAPELMGNPVGVLVPLSGPAQALGEDMLRAAEMALFDVGANDLVLLPRDTGGTATGARDAAQQVIDEGARLIIGPLFSQAVSGVTPVAQQAGVSVLAFSNVASVAAEDTYLLGFRPEEQVDRVVRYALEQEGIVRIAGLAPDDAYGAAALQALRRVVVEMGGEIGPTLFYPPDLSDPSPVVREVAAYDERRAALEAERAKLEGRDDEVSKRALERMKQLDTFGEPPFDAILIADGGDRLRSVASLLTFYDVDPGSVRFLGTMRWQDDPRVLGESALQGGWFAGPSPTRMAAFERRFENAFGTRPQTLAALAYDATALAVVVARELGDESYQATTLVNPQGFAGASGLFRLRPDGLAEHGLAVLEIGGGVARVLEPPPESFVVGMAERATPAAASVP